MDAQMKRDIEAYIRREEKVSCVVSKITEARTLDELKSGVMAFIEFSDSNPKLKGQLCDLLIENIYTASKPYQNPPPSQYKNVVFVPSGATPVVMIPTCVPISAGVDLIYEGLNRLLEKIGEYIDPMEDIATEDEMNAVLDNAQKKFRILDIIAPVKPLMILSFSNSHELHNCQCGIADTATSRESVILVYHPREVSMCDRVFIFAHEVGHALHIALTGDIEVIPDRFDAFNEALGINWQTTQEKQEAFADITAFAILNGGGLNKHLPSHFSDSMPDIYDRYIGYVTSRHLNP